MDRQAIESALGLVVRAAPDLRKAGVLSVNVGDLAFTLAPDEPEPQQPQFTAEERQAEETEQLREKQRGKGIDDLDLYGSGQVPVRRRNKEGT